MDQPVYMDMDTYNGLHQRLLQQSSEQQQQQFQSQGIIIPGSDQQEVIVQDDQTQHVIYSPMKQNEHQYVSQDDSMQGQYIIQTPQSRQPQQVFYANINQQQQQQQTIALNQNLIAHQNQNQQKMVLQTPKVVVQRSNDILQSATSMAQIVDHQNQQTIQYQFVQPQMDQNQTQMLSLQQPTQQIKQTIYPQQTNQAPQQHFYLQQIPQTNVVQQSGTKILIQGGNQSRYSFIPKPQQQVQQVMQNQGGQIVQVNQQQPQQVQAQGAVRQFRPRLGSAPVRLQNVRMGSPQNVQQVQMVNQQRPRASKPRIVRPPASVQQQQPTQVNQQQQRFTQPGNKTFYIVQTQADGSTVLIPHSQYNQQNQQQQVFRMVQKVVQTNSPPQQQQSQIPQTQYQVAQIAQPQQQPQPTQNAIEDVHAAILAPKKDGDCDDLEDSITATAISKSARSEPPPLQPQSGAGISLEEYRKRSMPAQANSNRIGVVRPIMNTTGSQMKSPTRNPALQVIRQRPPPRQQFQQQGVQEVEVQERESAKMLVILDNGEQRLITFTLPKETCTVQELLDQVGIQVGADSNIECIENPGSEIDYIVKVGNFASRDTAAMTKAAENHIRQQQNRLQNQTRIVQSPQQTVSPAPEVAKAKVPEVKLPPPKLVPGFYAVCPQCGISGADHAKCQRCSYVFTEVPKMQRMTAIQPQKVLPGIASSTQTLKVIQTISRGSIDKKDQIEALQKKHQLTVAQKAGRGGRGGMVTSTPRAKAVRKPKNAVPEIVTLSSDDESGSDEPKKEEVVILKKPFEPEIVEDVPADDFVRHPVDEFSAGEQKISTSVACRTIRIGTHKFETKEKVVITSRGIRIVAPSVKNPKDLRVLNIQHSEIVKVVVHFTKQLHIIFLYTKPSCARFIVGQLDMTQSSDSSPFYSSVARMEPQKKIVFLAETVSDETKSILKSIYNAMILEEISNRDANDMLVRSTGIPLMNTSAPVASTPNNTMESSNAKEIEVRKLLIYPPGRGGISVSTDDYVCLATDNYLNDVIIDFYLQYLFHEILTPDQQSKTHIFSQFFYKRLTTVTKDKDSKLSAAQKRHNRVASWTKNVNIFEKDFIIIPINEQSHWFLAIICFAHLTEPHTMDTNQPIKLIPAKKRAKKKSASLQIGNTTITPLNKKEETINLGDGERSERDEAEGEESDLGSNLESDDEEVVDRGQAVKVPCILIFDSLLGAPRARIVATLRDYLGCEYKAKFPNLPPRTFTKSSIQGNQVKVPQQNNFTDCGVFLLQYVEHFFKDPIKDFRVPLQSHIKWFHQDIVTRKREEIAKLIDTLIKRSKPDGLELPEIAFPSKDGKILEQAEEVAADSAFDDNEYVPTEEDLNEASQNGASLKPVEETRRVLLPKKRSLDRNDSSSGESTAKTPKFSSRNKS